MRITAIILGALIATAAVGCDASTEPTAVQPAEQKQGADKEGQSGKPAGAPEKPVPIKVTAKKTAYVKQEFATGGPYTCARVVVTNQSTKNIDVNPYYFAVTGVDGEKREAAIGAAEDEFESLTLAPKEKASGTVCSETKSPPKVITFTDPVFSEAARAEVG